MHGHITSRYRYKLANLYGLRHLQETDQMTH
jgi:hypothetical protein